MGSASTLATLIFFNKTWEDIPWRAELDNLSKVKVMHVLSEQENFAGPKGRVRKELLEPHMSGLGSRPLVLVCGPVGFTRTADSILRLEFAHCFDDEDGGIHLFQ